MRTITERRELLLGLNIVDALAKEEEIPFYEGLGDGDRASQLMDTEKRKEVVYAAKCVHQYQERRVRRLCRELGLIKQLLSYLSEGESVRTRYYVQVKCLNSNGLARKCDNKNVAEVTFYEEEMTE